MKRNAWYEDGLGGSLNYSRARQGQNSGPFAFAKGLFFPLPRFRLSLESLDKINVVKRDVKAGRRKFVNRVQQERNTRLVERACSQFLSQCSSPSPKVFTLRGRVVLHVPLFCFLFVEMKLPVVAEDGSTS